MNRPQGNAPYCVVLDSNILIQDWHLESNAGQSLLFEARRGKFRLVVPELVILETVNRFREEAERAIGKVRDARDTLRQLQIEDLIGITFGDSTDKVTARYENRLRGLLTAVNTAITPFPAIGHRELVDRFLDRRKPTREGDRGYRDALLWESVLELAAQFHQRIAFLSANKKDFADSEGKLAPDLQNDLKARNIDITRVELIESLRTFVDLYIPQAAQDLIKFEQWVLEDPTFGELFYETVEYVIQELVGREVELIGGRYSDFEDVSVRQFFGWRPGDFSFAEARNLEGGRALLTIKGTAEAELTAQISHDDLPELLENVSEVEVLEEDIKVGTALIAFESVVTIEFEAAYSERDERIESIGFIDVTALPPGRSPTQPRPQNETLF